SLKMSVRHWRDSRNVKVGYALKSQSRKNLTAAGLGHSAAIKAKYSKAQNKIWDGRVAGLL
ncbi:MAG: hypothetical protein RR368_08225, partial [Oscillospiraceae bacterium]